MRCALLIVLITSGSFAIGGFGMARRRRGA